MLRALLIDFDGTILDTEDAEYRTWQEVYERYGQVLDLETWATVVGTSGGSFDPVAHLEHLTDRALPHRDIRRRRRERDLALTGAMDARPGVRSLVAQAQGEGIALAIASSSRHEWIEGHLRRLGLLKAFQVISCSDDTGRGKPDPAVYLLALQRLGIRAAEAVAIEDSPNGALAASRAGVACLVVPNAVTANFEFPPVRAMRQSLEGVTLAEIVALLAADA